VLFSTDTCPDDGLIKSGERKMSDYPTVALIGPGAIGTTIAAVLHEVGRTPLLCGRTAHPQLILRHDEGEVVVPGPVLNDPAAISRPFDLVFVAVKTTQVADCASWLAALCDENTVVCALQNGVEQESQLAPYVNGATVLPSVVWFPAQREPDASVWLRAKPRLTLPDVPQAKRIVDVLGDTGCAVELSADFISIAWRKLLQNAVAGLMVLANRRAGMFSREDITELALAYLRECLAVARASGASLNDDVPQEIVDVFRRAPVDLGTSILADRQANRPLEWDIRNGVIQRYGRVHGIPVPISEVLVPLLAAGSEGPG
jgi:2-dehydropantoate 2-reductase